MDYFDFDVRPPSFAIFSQAPNLHQGASQRFMQYLGQSPWNFPHMRHYPQARSAVEKGLQLSASGYNGVILISSCGGSFYVQDH